ncbi:MAG TPA: type II toxin-antitoxin system VapC family toxin [Solirubrobacterales bacterium]|nr:type II toxin-antitoxin system VapC family toxin [Solirubrobacterales bacterium]
MEGRLRLLLDTHVMIWALEAPDRLDSKARAAIESRENKVFVSVVSPWELAIKGPREGLRLPDKLETEMDRRGFDLLPVLFRHMEPIGSMPYHHRDPFDRMLVAQALVDGLTIVTADRKMTNYQVSLLPAI